MKLIPATDELFELLKAKDDQVRGKKGAKVYESSEEESEEEYVKTRGARESPVTSRTLEVKYQTRKKKDTGMVDIENTLA